MQHIVWATRQGTKT